MSAFQFDTDAVKDPLALQPGNYRVEITQSEEKRGKDSGNLYWHLTLRALDWNCKLCHCIMMCEGDGAQITKSRLSALGLSGKIEAGHLLGSRTWVTVKEKPASGQYPRSLEVDIKGGDHCGFWKEKPGSVVEPAAPAASDDVPF